MTRIGILIVEDQLDVRKLMRLTLAIGDYRILEAEDGETALGLVRSERPALVLLDVMLPGAVGGLEVCRAVKADAELSSTRIVLLSARTQESDVEAGLEAGADRYVRKPFSPAELLEVVEEELSKAASSSDQKST